MNISLENWLRNKLQENEEMHDYAVATDTVRCWIDEHKQLSQPAVVGRSEQLCGNLDKNLKCKNMCLTHCIDGKKFWK